MSKYAWDNGNIRPISDEIEGQQTLAIDNNMNVDVAEEYEKPAIIDEAGKPAPDKELELIKGGRFNAKLFHEYYEDHTEKVLHSLLNMQSNDNPLKKGGDSIAFRCSAIINQNRQNYTVPQNTLLDIITARMSSRPHDNYYIITAKEIIKELPYTDKTYVYKIMSKASKELNRSPFIFEIELDNGKKKTLEFQWNEVLMYNGADSLDDDEDAYISFTPTKFFRILTLSSTIMHGAHYPVGVSAQISSKYARNLFYYLEDMKNYREYPGATPGRFVLSLDDFQQIVKYPSSYRTTDIRRYVLDVSVEEINQVNGIDFTFEYEFIKTGQAGSKKKISHIGFTIKKILDSKIVDENTATKVEISASDDAPLQVLKGIGLSDEECKDVLKKYNANNRNLVFLTQAITSVVTTNNVKSKCALLCHIMEEGLKNNLSYEENMKRIKEEKPQKKNTFNNFNQRNHSERYYALLERRSLGIELTEEEQEELKEEEKRNRSGV